MINHRFLKTLGISVSERPLLCVALMLYWTWLNLAFQGPLFFSPLALASGFLLPTWCAPVFAAALAYFVVGMWFRRTNLVIRQRWYIGFVATLMTLGALLCFLWIHSFEASLDSAIPLLLYLAGSLAIGLGTALLMIEWGRVFGYLGPQQALYHGIVAVFASALLVALLSLLPLFAAQLCIVLIPVPLAVCLRKTIVALPQKGLYTHGQNAELKIPYKFLFTALLHGLSLGILMGWLFLLGNQAGTSLLMALSFTLASVLLLLT
ncbi:MAG: hypothetical protein LBJ48_08150, partial [Coriobacteriales bacterium]|nr:hypothetical protein [Coriobacteriales bacterium]